ncbi:hypothetical protein ZIOFF_062967 [Zingiber officinale]|uniref:UTP23 sensor motif region domain-containing protein n=1 Tax=Zingiber officinale TaxID=94328 RepID=A0A8J5KB07_ZINOF|nr:hypothetical protein ZIOFF_062967 [Zingiber officinale]
MLALASESPIRCIIGELRSLGESHHEALEAAQQLMMARKKHEKRINTTACIESIVGEPNSEHFFVATQDADMRKRFQEAYETSLEAGSTKFYFSYKGDADETLLGSACPKKRMLGVSQRSQFIRKRAKKLENLGVSMNMTRTLEQKQCFHQDGGLLCTNWGGTTTKLNTSSGGPPLAKTKTTGDINKETPLVSFFKHLTRIKMVERRAKGLYFNCDESYSTSHKCKCLMMTGKVRKRGKWIRKFSSMLLVVLYPTFELEDKINIEESDDVDVEGPNPLSCKKKKPNDDASITKNQMKDAKLRTNTNAICTFLFSLSVLAARVKSFRDGGNAAGATKKKRIRKRITKGANKVDAS